MRALLRRRVIVPAAVAIVGAAVVMGAAWYLLSGERRMGSLAEQWLVRRTGLPFTVERASWNGRRVLLRDIHLAPSPALPIQVRVRELTIDAGLGALVSSAGRPISVAATGATIGLADPSVVQASVDALRIQVLSFLAWPGQIAVRALSAAFRTEAGVTTFDFSGEKQGPGLALAVTVVPPVEGVALRFNVRGAAALGRALDLVVDVAGPAGAVAALWPGASPPAAPIAGRVQLQLLAGGVVSAFGRFSVGADGAARTALDFTTRYDSTTGDLGISRYMLALGEDVRLSGTARLAREATGRRLSGTAAGVAAGSRVSATGSYEPGSRAFEADVRIDGADAASAARRLGVDVRAPASARSVHARLSGFADAKTLKVIVNPDTSRVTTAR